MQMTSPLCCVRKVVWNSLKTQALQESKRQADLDEALRDARALRMDLGHEQRRCEGKLTGLIAQQCELEARSQRLTEKQRPLPRHLKQRSAETEHNLREVCPFLSDSAWSAATLKSY